MKWLKIIRKAEQNFNQAVKLYPEYAEAYFGLAKVNFELNKIEDSKIYLVNCLSINPGFIPEFS